MLGMVIHLITNWIFVCSSDGTMGAMKPLYMLISPISEGEDREGNAEHASELVLFKYEERKGRRGR